MHFTGILRTLWKERTHETIKAVVKSHYQTTQRAVSFRANDCAAI